MKKQRVFIANIYPSEKAIFQKINKMFTSYDYVSWDYFIFEELVP